MTSTYLRPDTFIHTQLKELDDQFSVNKRPVTLKFILDDDEWKFFSIIVEVDSNDYLKTVIDQFKEKIGFFTNLSIYTKIGEEEQRNYLKIQHFKKIHEVITELKGSATITDNEHIFYFNFESVRDDPLYLTKA